MQIVYANLPEQREKSLLFFPSVRGDKSSRTHDFVRELEGSLFDNVAAKNTKTGAVRHRTRKLLVEVNPPLG